MTHNNNNSISRRRFLKMAATAAVGATAAACLPATTAEPAATAAPGATAVPATAIPAATSAPAATASASTANLIYKFPGTTQKDTALVAEALSSLLKEKINATVDLQLIDWGSYEQKVQLANAANEAFDIVYTPPWINSYYDNVQKGALLELDDLLQQHAPELWGKYTPETWNAARVGGKIYGVIHGNIWVKAWGAYMRKDLVEKYGLDWNSLTKYEDLEPFLEQVKQGEGIFPLYTTKDEGIGGVFKSEYYGIDPLYEFGSNTTIVGVRYDDKELKAFLVPESPEYLQAAELARKWYMAGYFPDEALPAADANAKLKAGEYAGYLHVYKPGGEYELKPKFGYDFLGKGLAKVGFLTTAGVAASLTGIPKTTPNPVAAMQYLNLIHTDPVAYNLLAKGIEGKHWAWADEARKVIGFPEGVTAETNGYNPNTDWMFGDQFNAYFITPEQADGDVWNATKKINSDAAPSNALGFAFVSEPVKSETAQVQSVAGEYFLPLQIGAVDPAVSLPEYIEKLKAAGAEKIVEEVQKQLDAWKAG
jgi:putative aldouronate transport system substrate-binding protein